MLNGDLDLCAFFAGKVKSNLMTTKMNVRFENLTSGCPIVGRPLIVQDLRWDFDNYPDVLPAGDWRVDTEYYTKVRGRIEWIIKTEIFIQVKNLRSNGRANQKQTPLQSTGGEKNQKEMLLNEMKDFKL